MQAKAEQRSKLLYDAIDSSEGYYHNGVLPQYRSRMNIPFRVKNNEDLEKKFASDAAKAGLMDLAGHRSVGGCRASLYNAMTIEGV
jgi:phosphoserine aminotransferase